MTEKNNVLQLNLRIHVMDCSKYSWEHSSNVTLRDDWFNGTAIDEEVMQEVNNIWSQADIFWKVEDTIHESIIQYQDYEDEIEFVLVHTRDDGESSRRSDSLRAMMDPDLQESVEYGDSLFHLYIFPFVGNTKQGFATLSKGPAVIGSWSNKYSSGSTIDKMVPYQMPLVEDQNNFEKGSMARTIAHELGHVLSLDHYCDAVDPCLMSGEGYNISPEQSVLARDEAERRLSLMPTS